MTDDYFSEGESYPDGEKQTLPETARNRREAYGGERQYLRTDEIEKLLKVARTYGHYGFRNYCLILVSYRHGFRVGEVVRLKWDQIDFKRAYMEIKRLKGGLDTRHPIQGDELRALRRLYDMRTSDVFVFTDRKGTPLTPSAVQKIYDRVGERSGLGLRLHPHMMRHSCGHYLAEKGVDVLAIRDYLGHRDVRNTLVYTVASPERFRKFWE